MKSKKINYCKKPTLLKINNNNVFVYKNHNKSIYISAIIPSGIINETKKTIGISHLLEHLLINSWRECSKNNCMSYLNKLGIKFNATTYSDHILYYAYGSLSDFQKILDYIIDISNKPNILQKNLDKEKLAVKTELLQNFNSSTSKLNYIFCKYFFDNIGLKNSANYELLLKNNSQFSLNDLIQWYNKYYKNITYFIIGDFNYHSLVSLLQAKLPYNKISSLISKSNNIFSYKHNLIFVENKKSKITSISIGFPNNINPVHKDYLYLDIVCIVLQNILFDHLRNKYHLVYGVNVTKQIFKENSYISISINSNSENASKVINYVFYIINQIKLSYDSTSYIKSQKKFFNYSYYNTLLNNSNNQIYKQYTSQILYFNFDKNYKIISLCEYKLVIDKFNSKKFKNLITELFQFDKSLVVYQNFKKLLI